MWCLVLFDLPTRTKAQRKAANDFRKLLESVGFSRLQLSAYVKYAPCLAANLPTERRVQASVPADGEVVLVHLTDNQWAKASRLTGGRPTSMEAAPQQLVLF